MTPSKLGETGIQKMQNGKYFFGEKNLKIAHGLNFTPKMIFGGGIRKFGSGGLFQKSDVLCGFVWIIEF